MWRRQRPSHELAECAGPAASRKSLHFTFSNSRTSKLAVQASSNSASRTQGSVIKLQAFVGISSSSRMPLQSAYQLEKRECPAEMSTNASAPRHGRGGGGINRKSLELVRTGSQKIQPGRGVSFGTPDAARSDDRMILAPMPGFALRWLWYLSVVSVVVQLILSLALLRREFARRLRWDSVAA